MRIPVRLGSSLFCLWIACGNPLPLRAQELSRPEWLSPVFYPRDSEGRLRDRHAVTQLLRSTVGPNGAALLHVTSDTPIQVGPTIPDSTPAASFWVYVDETGIARNTVPRRSSGSRWLDLNTIELCRQLTFQPALYHGRPTPVWIAVQLQVEGMAARDSFTPRSDLRPISDAQG